MTSRVTWSDLKKRRTDRPAVREGYRAASVGYRLAERVRILREHRGLSQQDLADRIGSTQSAVSRLEAGGAEPSLTTLERIGRALDAKLVVEFAGAIVRPDPSIAKASWTARPLRPQRRSFARKATAKEVARKR
jgi:transcriptional regulator with XRE-family HTH domain